MKLVVGLGNPGKKYEQTKHNLGFQALDLWADKLGFSFEKSSKFKAEMVEHHVSGAGKVLVVKPQTYMNLSGETVGPLAHFYKIEPEDILVVFDDLDMPAGRLRLARKGSSGGHNGIKSIIASLGNNQNFARLKLGIGRPKHVDEQVIDHVLQKFSKEDEKRVQEQLERCPEAIETFLKEGIDVAMNRFNN